MAPQSRKSTSTGEIGLTPNATTVLQHRYLIKDESGAVAETPPEMFRRVARAVAEAERAFGGQAAVDETADRFSDLLSSLEFLPNSPTLMNAGTPLGQMSACFVLPVPDSIEGIFGAVKLMAIIHQTGGGTGFSFSQLRPKGDRVRPTGGAASGPISFMRVFDMATEVVRQGGRRRGANMGILRADHPDIREFVTAKTASQILRNFNLSVAADARFMEAVDHGQALPLVNPRTGKPTGECNARELFDLIARSAWECGDPGLVFIDRINAAHPLAHLGPIESTNPCGEQPLLPYESCVLGSINLLRMMRGRAVDWDKLRETVALAVRFLDDVIDAQRYPIPEIEQVTRANRKIGLGVMGFADLLIQMGVPYASEDAIRVGDEIMRFINEAGWQASAELGKQRGSFATFPGSAWEKRGLKAMRNGTVTTVAPTGTISIIAGVSSGIEPVFALSYVRRVLDGQRLLEEHPLFVAEAKRRGFYSRELMEAIAHAGSAQTVEAVPDDVKRLFGCAMDIEPIWHVRMQAAFQKHTDNAVSKTVNLPSQATVADVEGIYRTAWQLGCKGITVYRYGCKAEQTLSLPGAEYAVPAPEGEDAGTGDSLELSAEETGQCRQCAS